MLKPNSRIDYRLDDKFDIVLFSAVVLLLIVGLTAIYSATINHPTANENFSKQLFFAIASIIFFFIIYFLHPRTFKYIAIPGYVLSIIFLVAVMFVGKTVYGAKSWLSFGGPIGFQPSEFAKIGMIFMLALFLSRDKTNINNFWNICLALMIGMFPVALILLEPDMGTSLVFMAIILVMLFWKGVSLFLIFTVVTPVFVVVAFMFGKIAFFGVLILILTALIFFKKNFYLSAAVFLTNVGSGFLFDYIYKAMKPHQQKRIATFLDPNADPLGAGYNAIQAKVAIGSGGIFGKGFLQGNQTQLQYIPEQWTDFIFCVIGEEFGFLGSVFTIILFLILFLRLLRTASALRERNEFFSLVTIGILALMLFHFMINVGMTVGIMPVIGLPLPLLSYGGSSLLVNMFLIGFVANVYRNRMYHS